jgi:hypothetical protein
MSARSFTPPAAAGALRRRMALPPLLRHAAVALLVWLAAFAALAARPAFDAADLRGAYANEAGARPFRWTGAQATAPLYPRSGPTYVDLDLGAGRWEGRAPQQVTLSTDTAPLASFAAPEQLRRYRLLLPPGAAALRIDTAVQRPPQGDPRWLGVQLFGLRAAPTGLPLRAARDGLLLALLALPLSLLAELALRRGCVEVVALGALALLLRLLWLDRLPPGFNVDEVVSLVDAWHLLHTGRDHLGHLLPLGAFEAFGDWISPLLTYLELPFVALLGPAPLAGRLVTALAGALAAPAGYGLARALALPRPAAALLALVAALSPWQIVLSRTAIPPGLVPLAVTLCVWAGVALIRRGDRASALWLALAGGLALYAYPTLKLFVPLLGVLAGALALRRHGLAALRRWWPAALLVALLWLPFAYTTLFNPYSNMRWSRKALEAETTAEWAGLFLANYASYATPDFYYVSGDPGRYLPEPAQFPAEAPLVLLGLGVLLLGCVAPLRQQANEQPRPVRLAPLDELAGAGLLPREVWWFLTGALLLAPLPASLTSPNPHILRGAIVAPLYALLAALGGGVVWRGLARLGAAGPARAVRGLLAAGLAAALLWQGGQWFVGYLRDYPHALLRPYQDGLLEASQRAVALAPQFDQIWIDGGPNQAPIYLIAAQPFPPAEAQARTVARTALGRFTLISRVGPYLFGPPALKDVPTDLPVLATALDQLGETGFVLQPWQHEGQRVLVVRRMWRR